MGLPNPNDQETPDPEQASGWQSRSGLDYQQVENLLDWLEAHGITNREVQWTPEGFLVRWQQ